jgi:peptidoglycan/LPS O-acetylase OafA/YrhL
MFPEGWLPSITIIGLQPRSPILVVPAWSLHVELIYYILIGAILGRSRLLTVLWFVFALVMPVVALLLRGVSFEWLYFSPYGSSIAFATGAMIYQFREKLPAISPILAIIACCVLIFLGLKMSVSFAGAGGMHLSIIVTAVAIAGLKDTAMRRWDSALGELAYPVFLMHIPCRAAMYGLVGRSNVWIDLAAIATTIALSCLMVALVERPLSLVRTKLRSPDSTVSRWIVAWRQS